MKKKYSVLISFLYVLLFSTLIFANGNSYSTQQSTAKANTTKSMNTQTTYHGQEYAITVNIAPGSLKENIERIAKDNGWQAVWKAPDDFNWPTNTKIKDQNLVAVMKAILTDYPLQAVFYQGNRVLVIQTRTVR